MKLKIIQDPEVKEMADVLNYFEFDDWDLVLMIYLSVGL